MTYDRRQVLRGGLGAAAGFGAVGAASQANAAAGRRPRSTSAPRQANAVPASQFGLVPDSGKDVSAKLQRAIDKTSAAGQTLLLAPGTYKVAAVRLRGGTSLIGTARASKLQFTGGKFFLLAANAPDIRLEGLVLDGAHKPLDTDRADGLLMAYNCQRLTLRDLDVTRALVNGISLRQVSGRVSDCSVSQIGQCGIFSLDALGLGVGHNSVKDCANNGIQIWRSEAGEDGSIVAGNRIERIKSSGGGSGQNGNGVNVFRAGSVLVEGNRITDCAYSAVRGNAASNIQISSNSCQRIGEVALYAEFGFEGAMIANNLVDGAASGIAATNFNEGGRLALIQGNMLRNLTRREWEPQDKRGNGIGVEADALVCGNIIENAQTAGIMVGWGSYLRDVSVTSNLIRNAPLGIGISTDPQAGTCLVANNMICGSRIGAIRAMDHDEPKGDDLVAQARDGKIFLSGNVAS